MLGIENRICSTLTYRDSIVLHYDLWENVFYLYKYTAPAVVASQYLRKCFLQKLAEIDLFVQRSLFNFSISFRYYLIRMLLLLELISKLKAYFGKKSANKIQRVKKEDVEVIFS